MYFTSIDEDCFSKKRKDTELLKRKNTDSVRKFRAKQKKLIEVKSGSQQHKLSTTNENNLVLDSTETLSEK